VLSLVESTTGGDGTIPDKVGIDDTSFYWSVLTNMWRVPRSGGTGELVTDLGGLAATSNFLNGFLVDATSIYWPWEGAIMRMPKSGGAPLAFADGLSDSTTVALDTAYVYAASSNQAAVARVPLAGGASSFVANGASCERLAVDDANIYCRTRFSIVRFSKTGAPTALLATTTFAFNMVLSDSQLVFDDADKLKVVPVTGGAITTVDAGTPHFSGLGAYGNVAYLVNDFTEIRRVPLDGAGITIMALGGFYVVDRVLVDGSGLYWMDRRWTCLRESVRDPDPAVYGDAGQHTCEDARNEIRVVRAPLAF
jgi:hypothetical protein